MFAVFLLLALVGAQNCHQRHSLGSCAPCLAAEQCQEGWYCCPRMKKCVSSSSYGCTYPIADCSPNCFSESEPEKCSDQCSPTDGTAFPSGWTLPLCECTTPEGCNAENSRLMSLGILTPESEAATFTTSSEGAHLVAAATISVLAVVAVMALSFFFGAKVSAGLGDYLGDDTKTHGLAAGLNAIFFGCLVAACVEPWNVVRFANDWADLYIGPFITCENGVCEPLLFHCSAVGFRCEGQGYLQTVQALFIMAVIATFVAFGASLSLVKEGEVLNGYMGERNTVSRVATLSAIVACAFTFIASCIWGGFANEYLASGDGFRTVGAGVGMALVLVPFFLLPVSVVASRTALKDSAPDSNLLPFTSL